VAIPVRGPHRLVHTTAIRRQEHASSAHQRGSCVCAQPSTYWHLVVGFQLCSSRLPVVANHAHGSQGAGRRSALSVATIVTVHHVECSCAWPFTRTGPCRGGPRRAGFVSELTTLHHASTADVCPATAQKFTPHGVVEPVSSSGNFGQQPQRLQPQNALTQPVRSVVPGWWLRLALLELRVAGGDDGAGVPKSDVSVAGHRVPPVQRNVQAARTSLWFPAVRMVAPQRRPCVICRCPVWIMLVSIDVTAGATGTEQRVNCHRHSAHGYVLRHFGSRRLQSNCTSTDTRGAPEMA
jgi:hypothetical protein